MTGLLRLGSSLLFVLGGVYLAVALCRRLAPRAPIAVRWTAIGAVGTWTATVAFHALLPLGGFRLEVAAPLFASGVALLRWRSGYPFARCARQLARDVRWPARCWRLQPRSGRVLFAVFGSLLALTAARAALLPALGWDSVTYHAVKSALWVQGGGPIALEAPGGWGFYRSYLGGGELLGAWAMLPLHGDGLLGLVDALQWLLLLPACYALGAELGLRGTARFAAVVYVLSLPALQLAVGSGYVELALVLALVSGLVFGLRFLRSREAGMLLLSGMAFGVAGGIKFTALPVAAAALLLLLGVGRLGRPALRTPALVAALLAAAVAVAPWLAWNVATLGLPLSPMPVEVAGLALGEPSEALRWYQWREGLSPYTWRAELGALANVFASPFQVTPHLSRATLPALLLALPGGFRLARRRPLAFALVGGTAALLLASYFSPDFSSVRLLWSETNGRFLALPVALGVLLALSPGAAPRRVRAALIAFLLVAASIHFAGGVSLWARFEYVALPAAVACAALLAAAARSALLSPRLPVRAPLRVASALTLALAALSGVAAARDAVRPLALQQSAVLHPAPRYWRNAALFLDGQPEPRRIAVTSGAYHNADNWHLFHFLGGSLENTLHYVPITPDGRILDWAQGRERWRAADFDAWWQRVRAAGITEIVSYLPAGIELAWLEGRPDLFERLDGDGHNWGVYRVRATEVASDDTPDPAPSESSGGGST